MTKGRIRVRHKSARLRKDSKTLPIYGSPDRGDGEDHDRYYKCWNCGFICDSDRDQLGDSDSIAHLEPVAYTQTDQYGNTSFHCQGAAGDDQTTCEAAGGTWSSTRYKASERSGCKLCGTLNWRGDN